MEHSPLLADELLVEIIQNKPVSGALSAISRRRTVSERVSDAVISTNDDAAITDLLGNASAQIREETLDELIDTARDRPVLHRPLVTRPKLLDRHAISLAKFIGYALVTGADLGIGSPCSRDREKADENPALAESDQS